MGLYARITARMDERSHLMGAMMKELGVDIESATMQSAGASFANAARACLACRSVGECQHWLDDCAANGMTSQPSFCPNRTFFGLHRK